MTIKSVVDILQDNNVPRDYYSLMMLAEETCGLWNN